MNDQINTIDDLNRLFQEAIISALGLEDNAQRYDMVRVTSKGEEHPAWTVNDDICVIFVQERDHDINAFRNRVLSEVGDTTLIQAIQYTRYWQLRAMFYGPHAVDNARKAKSFFYLLTGHDMMAAGNLFLVPTNRAPMRTPLLYEGNWYERADLIMYFNENVIERDEIPFMAEADVKLYVDNGMERDITVTAETPS
jgi:hypothetical protein